MEPLIQISDLHKSFGKLEVLRGLSLNIDRGESVVIVGRSGCGKSVLLKHLVRLLDPDQGSVSFEGADLAGLNTRSLVAVRLRIGMLFQSAALFDSMTVAENVGLGLVESRRYTRNEIKDIVSEKLELVGLTDAAEIAPAELSGGMRKRVGLARAIAGNPEVLLYDEPTTGLDPVTAERIDDLIVRLNRKLKVTSIAVTHDMKSAFKIAGRIVMLYEGQVIFDGAPDEMFDADSDEVTGFIRSSFLERRSGAK